MIPGLAMFTARAEPLATWMTGLEVAYFKVSTRLGVRRLVCHVVAVRSFVCVSLFAIERSISSRVKRHITLYECHTLVWV